MSKNKETLVILFCTICVVFCPIGICAAIGVSLKHSDLTFFMTCVITWLSYRLFSEVNENRKLKERIETLNEDNVALIKYTKVLSENIGAKK